MATLITSLIHLIGLEAIQIPAKTYILIIPVCLQVTGVRAIMVNPNPVTYSVINNQFSDMIKGIYTLNLINNLGQTLHSILIILNGPMLCRHYSFTGPLR